MRWALNIEHKQNTCVLGLQLQFKYVRLKYMRCANTYGDVTRRMCTVNQALHAWTYRRPKPYGFNSMIPSGVVTLCDQWHYLDEWACAGFLWGPQSDDTNLSVRTWVDLLDLSEGPFGWLRYLSSYTHDVTYFNVRRCLTPFGKLLEGGQILLWPTLAIGDVSRLGCQRRNDDMGLVVSARLGNASKGCPIRK